MNRTEETDEQQPSRVNVIVRVRPRNDQLQVERYDQTSIFVDHSITATRSVNVVALSPESKEQIVFGYDCVFDDADGQDTVFSESIEEPLSVALDMGTDLTVLAYGQTGSGKTYTMLGEPCAYAEDGVLALSDRSGVFLRSLYHLLATRDAMRATVHLIFVLSAVEIYNDVVVDLLSQKKNSVVETREVAEDLVLVNQERFVISTVEDAQKCFLIAHRNRSVSSTMMNERSSRSHALFFIDVLQQIIVPQKNVDPPDLSTVVEYLSSKLSASQTVGPVSQFAAATVSASLKASASPQRPMQFTRTPSKMAAMAENMSNDFSMYPLLLSRLTVVDLAGSERVKKSGVQGKELNEAVVVNKSLSALGLVVNCIRNGAKHIPFRDSKLTRLLRPSFVKPAARIVFITNVSPVAGSYSETLSSLRFASRLKEVNWTPFALSSASCAPVSVLELRVLKLQLTVEELAADNRIAQETFEYGRSLNDSVRRHRRSLRLATDSHRLEMERREEIQLAEVEEEVATQTEEFTSILRSDEAHVAESLALEARISKRADELDSATAQLASLVAESDCELEQWKGTIETEGQSLDASSQTARSLTDIFAGCEARLSMVKQIEDELSEKEYVSSHSIAFLDQCLSDESAEVRDLTSVTAAERAAFESIACRLHQLELLISLSADTDRLFSQVGKLREEVLSTHYASLAAAAPKELIGLSGLFPNLQMPSLDEVNSRITTTPPSPYHLGDDESDASIDDFPVLDQPSVNSLLVVSDVMCPIAKKIQADDVFAQEILFHMAPVMAAMNAIAEFSSDKRLGVTREIVEGLFRSLNAVPVCTTCVSTVHAGLISDNPFSHRVEQLVTAVIHLNYLIDTPTARRAPLEGSLVGRIRSLRVLFYPFLTCEQSSESRSVHLEPELERLRVARQVLRRHQLLDCSELSTLFEVGNSDDLSQAERLSHFLSVAVSTL